jgi:glycosyltransferase involved in cell wall biosynthesis
LLQWLAKKNAAPGHGGFVQRAKHDSRDRSKPAAMPVRKVRFLPKSADVLQFYAAADICVAPSLEGAFGLPVLEAMACGLPVVSSPRAGVSEIIDDRMDGFVLRDPEDSHELAELLRMLCSNSELCRQIGERAIATAVRNGWEANVDQLWDLFEARVEQKKNS